MKTATDRLAELNARLKDMPSPDRVRIPDDGKCLEAGQLWTPVELPQDTEDTPDLKNELPSWLYLLIEPLQAGLFNAVPVFRWTELADDDDLLLPARLAGLRLAASLSLDSTIDRTMLEQCQGRYPDTVIDYILAASIVADDHVARNQYRWGAPLLGPDDHRIAFHNAISDAIEDAQASVREAIYSEAKTTTADSETGEAIFDNIIDLPIAFSPIFPIEELALAAASDSASANVATQSYEIVGHPLQLEVSASSASEDCDFVVYGLDDTPSDSLDGVVVTAASFVSKPFINGQTAAPRLALEGGFRLRRPDGGSVELRAIPGNN